MATEPGVTFRPAVADDMRFILSSWKKSWRVCPWAGTIRNDKFYAVVADTIESLVVRGAEFAVACLTSQPDRILGWVCAEVLRAGESCVHMVYVKDPYLRFDIGARLVQQVPGTRPGVYTHRTRQTVESCGPDFHHAPEAARRK